MAQKARLYMSVYPAWHCYTHTSLSMRDETMNERELVLACFIARQTLVWQGAKAAITLSRCGLRRTTEAKLSSSVVLGRHMTLEHGLMTVSVRQRRLL